ncbi:hypothetical protein SHIRM173S_02924 [Streptomyces hirsutus]
MPPRSAWTPPAPLEETLDRTAARVFVQAIPSSPELRLHAAEEALVALRRGVHVVTATKSHLLSHWRDLDEAARAAGSMIRISGATGAALPAGDLAGTSLRGLGCTTIRACPNGTATFVLDRLAEGDSLGEAIREARRRGTAEADPSSDLSGADAATKVRLLAALAWGWDPASVQVRAEPVDEGTSRAALDAVSRARRLRAVASASLDEPHLVRVRLEADPGDPLHALVGPEKAVVFGCPEAGDVIVERGTLESAGRRARPGEGHHRGHSYPHRVPLTHDMRVPRVPGLRDGGNGAGRVGWSALDDPVLDTGRPLVPPPGPWPRWTAGSRWADGADHFSASSVGPGPSSPIRGPGCAGRGRPGARRAKLTRFLGRPAPPGRRTRSYSAVNDQRLRRS